ncbi:hypothetical protein F4780DRAFT_83315 [Xylariomycetidae sp. FL0641]|nr:hypothetical protein F4780DRAFT_83315 [Xylariomycetidae sp. FL0641]
MVSSTLLVALCGALSASVVEATDPAQRSVVTKAGPRPPAMKNANVIQRSPHGTVLRRDQTEIKNSTSIQKSWQDAALLNVSVPVAQSDGTTVTTGIEITCITCYITGNAAVHLTYDDDFNITRAVQNFTAEVGDEVTNLTDSAIDYVKDYISGVVDNLEDGFDLDDFDFPPLNMSFNLDVPDLPETNLNLQFDDLEMYMMLDTVISAGTTYTVTMYTSETPIGLALDSKNFAGVIFDIVLIMSADANIDMTGGVHMKVDDGLGIDIAMFGQNVSSISYNGGTFEFLPVTVQTTGGILKAVLRIGVKAGIEFQEKSEFIPGAGLDTSASAGMAVSVYADLAEFTTNITAAGAVIRSGGDQDDDAAEDCRFQVQQAYQLGLGAAAGATLALGPGTWGPQPATAVPIWYTTLAAACVGSATTSTSSSRLRRARDDQTTTTTTLTHEVTQTGTACLSAGLLHCPVSLQTTTKVTATRTRVTAVRAGERAAFPAATRATVESRVPFGRGAAALAATSGAPTSYVPPPPPAESTSTAHATGVGRGSLGETQGVVIGVGVGVGVPVLAAVVVGIWFFCSRRRRAFVPVPTQEVEQPEEADFVRGAPEKRTSNTVEVAVAGRR